MTTRNMFKAPKNADVRDKCEVFKMTAVNEKDMEFLAALYRTVWINGGRVIIEENDSPAHAYVF